MDTETSTFQSTFHTARNRWAVLVAKLVLPVAVEKHNDKPPLMRSTRYHLGSLIPKDGF